MAELDDIADEKLREEGIFAMIETRRAFILGWVAAVEHMERDLVTHHVTASFVRKMEQMMKDSDGSQG